MESGDFRLLRSEGRPEPCRRAAGTLLWLLALLLFPSQAHAQAGSDSAPAEAQAVIVEPGSFVRVDDMDFGTIAQPGAPGTVVLTPAAAATCTPTGGLVRTGDCQAARFAGDTTFFFVLRVTRPAGNQMFLNGPGGATMRVSTFTFGVGSGLLNLGPTPTEQRYLVTSGTGNFQFYVGGTLHVGANQAHGSYAGTFPIQVNYN
jgi:hypothetical protein